MERINSSNAVANLFGVGKSGFGAGVPATGTKATYLSPEWCNGVQEAISRVIESKLGDLDPDDHEQLLKAINAVVPEDALRATVSKTLSAGFYSWPVTLDIDPDTGATIAYYSIRNVYKLAVTRAVTISNPDAGNHPPGGMAVIVATNDATGHPLVFDTQYRIAAGEWDDSANAVNLMFLVFSPDGVIDVYITQRGEAA